MCNGSIRFASTNITNRLLPQDRLYYVSLRSKPALDTTKDKHFFCIDAELIYWNFFLDFGPLNLAQLYRFCQVSTITFHQLMGGGGVTAYAMIVIS